MSDATMSAVTLCDPSITDGAIKLRVIKTLLRKFRGKIFAKCCGYADTYIDPCCRAPRTNQAITSRHQSSVCA